MLKNNPLDTTMMVEIREVVAVAVETRTTGLQTIKDAMTGVTERRTT